MMRCYHIATQTCELCRCNPAAFAGTYYADDPTQRGDDIAQMMRDHYEAHKPLRWWQRRHVWNDCRADNLMLGLLNVASRALREAALQDAQTKGCAQ
jgi:hypothetical protein